MFLGSTFEMHTTPATWAGTGSAGMTVSPATTLTYLFDFKNAVQQAPIFGGLPLPIPNGEYWSAVKRVATLRFSFMTPDYNMFYWTIMFPFAIFAAASALLVFWGAIRGNISWG